MVVDTSAIIAIMAGEADAERYARAIERARTPLISAASWLETAMVLTRWYGDGVEAELDRLMQAAALEIVPVNALQARLALQAYLRFGKGRHPAALNYGDCMSYALAKASGNALLYKGADFAQTDIAAAD
jgi:ribonuclease VapC